jgi:CO/xanthine dehydrogenase Mo-binding subunit
MNSEKAYISAAVRPNLLHGVVVRTRTHYPGPVTLSVPPYPPDIIVITSKNIPGSNAVTVLKATMPLLAGETASYIGQPVAAVFASSLEKAAVAASQITISPGRPPTKRAVNAAASPEETAASEEESPAALEPEEQTLQEEGERGREQSIHPRELYAKTVSWGAPEKLFAEADSVLEKTYTLGTERSALTAPTGALAEVEGDTVLVHASTQWPFHVRSVVSDVCGVQKRKVVVTQTDYHPTHDEKLIYPSVYAGLCAVAALKSGRPARIIDTEPSWRPEMVVTRKTALNREKEPKAEIIDIQINVGAYAFFAEEMIEQTIAGAAPIYDIEAVQITVRLVTSPAPPRHNYKGLGYTSALSTTEAHCSLLAQAAQMNPVSWRIKHLKNSKSRPTDQIKIRYQLLKELLEQTAARSDFNRKYAVYEMQKRKAQNISPFYRYARGIGIAAGPGVTGFSRWFSEEKKHSAVVTLEENNMVRVALSIRVPEAEQVWKTIISEMLGVDTSMISIAGGCTARVPDTGPDLLRRDIHHVSGLIMRCCESIKSQRFKEPLPIKVKRGFKQPSPGDKVPPPFNGLNWGAVAVELEVEPVSLDILIKGLWGTFECGRIFTKKRVISALTKALNEAVHQCGGHRAHDSLPSAVDVDIALSDAALPSSANDSSYGLVAAAFMSAVSQALNTPVPALPITAEHVRRILAKEGEL